MGKEPVPAGSGGWGRKVWPSPPRVAEAALDDLFDHPAGVLNIFPNSRITFFMDSEMVF
jgi:hypothetical protein